ncbi:MAG: RNA polymerase sigma factor [Phycisphaerales bacterium]
MAHAISEPKLREWMARLGPALINLSMGICRDRHRAEEIVQEAFIKLWRCPPDAGEPAFSSWLRRVVTNLSINDLKRRKRPGPLPEFTDDSALVSREQGYAQVDCEDSVARIRLAMDRLDDDKRAILVLRANEGLSYEEIAEHLGVPLGTVMSRLNRARAALREHMDALESAGPAAHASQNESDSIVYRFKKQA